MSTAYDESMETLLLAFLLSEVNGNPALKEKLRSFLDFYRENRDMIALLMQNKDTMSKSETKKSENIAEQEKNFRPQSEVGNNDVLEQYLKNLL